MQIRIDFKIIILKILLTKSVVWLIFLEIQQNHRIKELSKEFFILTLFFMNIKTLFSSVWYATFWSFVMFISKPNNNKENEVIKR